MRHALASALFLVLHTAPASAGKLVLVAGGGSNSEGPATSVKLVAPFGVDFDRAGNMVIVELSGGRVHKVSSTGVLTTIAGSGKKGDQGDNGPSREALFNGMHSLAIGANDDIYIADTWNNRIRKIDARTGVITSFAGTGKKGYSGDGGPALQAEFGGIYCIALDPARENAFLTDLDNRRIRKVNLKTGLVTLVAGNGKKGEPRDGSMAIAEPLVDPRAAAVDRRGNVYILERNGHALRVVAPGGKIRTVVGTGKAGLSGDDGPAIEATLRGPKHLCLDQHDNVIIADTANHVIRKYTPADGRIVRVAGTGQKGSSGAGGDALAVQLNQPHGVFVNAAGVLFIVDSNNGRVFRLDE